MSGAASTITTNSKVSVGLLGGIFATIIAATWGGARWAATVDARLANIERDIATTQQQGADTWTRNDMSIWAQRLRELNEGSGVKVPVPLKDDQ